MKPQPGKRVGTDRANGLFRSLYITPKFTINCIRVTIKTLLSLYEKQSSTLYDNKSFTHYL